MDLFHIQRSYVLGEDSEGDSWLSNEETEAARFEKVKGVVINCDSANATDKYFTNIATYMDREQYVSVDVPYCHPIFEVPDLQYVPVALSDIFALKMVTSQPVFPVNLSPVGISKLIELPILVREYPQEEARKCTCSMCTQNFPQSDNTPATYLRVNVDPMSKRFGYLKLCTTNVLAVREDCKVLLPFHMKALCCFCQIKVVPLIKQYLKPTGQEQTTLDDLMRYMTKASFEIFFTKYRAEEMAKDPYWIHTPSPYAM